MKLFHLHRFTVNKLLPMGAALTRLYRWRHFHTQLPENVWHVEQQDQKAPVQLIPTSVQIKHSVVQRLKNTKNTNNNFNVPNIASESEATT